MKKLIYAFAVAALAAASCTKAVSESELLTPQEQILSAKLVGRTDGEIVPGRLLVKSDVMTQEMVQMTGVTAIRPAMPSNIKNKAVAEKFGLDKWYILEFDETVPPSEVAEKIAPNKEVTAVQYSRLLEPSWNETVIPVEDIAITKAEGTDLPFNDEYLPMQWNLINDGSIHADAVAGADVGVKDAWRLCAGDPSVVVAIFDLGINDIHTDLTNALWTNEGETRGNGKDDDGNGFIDDVNGFNFYKCKTQDDGTVKPLYPIDCSNGSGHGTHVAGIIGATNNNGKGVSSIAGGTGNKDGVKLMSCQIFYGENGAKGTDDEAALGFIYAADNGACIAQCSWGHTQEILKHDQEYIDKSPLEYAALQYFLAPENSNHEALEGNIAVFAAGNQGNPYSIYPGSLSEIISVTALDCRYLPAGYTNYGPGCKIAAPGGEWLGVKDNYSTMILSTGKGAAHAGTPGVTDMNNQYVFMYGTSMACPHVSGVLALGIAYAKKLGKKYTREEFTSMLLTSVNDIEPMLKGTKTFYESTTSYIDMPLEKYKGQMGTGAVDAWKFLMAVEGTPSFMVKAGEKSQIDITEFSDLGGKFTLTIDDASRASLGISEDPKIVDGKIEVNCTKIGAGKVTLSGSVGKDTEIADGIGAMSWTREFSIVSRPFATKNGGWL